MPHAIPYSPGNIPQGLAEDPERQYQELTRFLLEEFRRLELTLQDINARLEALEGPAGAVGLDYSEVDARSARARHNII